MSKAYEPVLVSTISYIGTNGDTSLRSLYYILIRAFLPKPKTIPALTEKKHAKITEAFCTG
jgi:hypothetical protein